MKYIRNNHVYVLSVLLISLCTACIHNDIPYPIIPQDIIAIEAQGETRPAKIDAETLTATIYLSEDVDLREVKFTSFEITEGAESSVNLLEGTYNLESPLMLTLSKYQDYEWSVIAEQTIDRYFTVAGQVGDSEISAEEHTVTVRMPVSADLSHLEVTSIKLGPKDVTTLSPDIRSGMEIDLSTPLELDVTAFGETEVWTITALHTDNLVATTAVDAWSKVIWAYGMAPEDRENGFQYRKVGQKEWTDVPPSQVQHDGGSFSACIPHLEPLTNYEVRAVSDQMAAGSMIVLTGATEDLPDGSFDQWWLDGKVWFPFSKGGPQFWDTGNRGAATLGSSNVTPTKEVPVGLAGQAAQLKNRWIVIKFAAGSIFTGKYMRTDGTNGVLNFGQPWSTRPTKMRGYMSYVTAPIDRTTSEMAHLKGENDTAIIYIALTDWDEPYEIRTNPKNRQLFDPDDPHVIAYGALEVNYSTGGYQPFEIELEYRSTSRRPKYILVVAAASKYGDYFTGAADATLLVDQFSLDYDY